MPRFFRHPGALLLLAAAVSAVHTAAARDVKLGLNTVVIDPGHGGNDPGCISKDRKTREKDLTLDISRRLAAKIRREYPEVKVIQTRDKDVFIPLVQRAQTANDAHADLFISVHINATTGTSANGYSVHILGQSSKKGRDLYSNNFNECARENSVILLEDDYSANYQGFDPNDPESSILFSLMQNAYLEQSLMFADDVNTAMRGGPFRTSRGVRQDPFLVLWKTAMPSVLIECGFISNASDLAVLRDSRKLDEIAEGIMAAFRTFKKAYDGSLAIAPAAQKPADTAPEQPPVAQVRGQETVTYGTQVLALSRRIPEDDAVFLGVSVRTVKDGNIYRYIAGCSGDRDSAVSESREIRKKFPDSFPVRVSPDGSVERIR